jgi:Mg-chelatase subunit ChlD
MSLLNPYLLFGSLALAIPILIHLVRREKSEIVQFSSLMFLLKVPKRAIRQQKIKNLLLMALRLLLLALLVGSFARPYFTADTSETQNAAQNRGIVLMLDNSYSMRYGTTFERLKNEAVGRIDAMTAGDRMALIAFNDVATMLSMPSSDKNALKAAVDALEPSFGATRYYEAFALADRVFGQLQGTEKLLWIASDFQRNGWNRSSRESVIGSDVKTEFVNLSVQNPVNVGIDSVSVEPQTSFARIYGGRVIARIHNHRKDQAVNVPVAVRVNDREAGRKTLNVPANSTALAEFTGFDLPLGFSKAAVKAESDDPLQVDNEFLFTLDRREKLKVLIVDSGRQGQSLYLRQAYTSSADVPFEVQIAAVQSVTPEELGNHQVVVVNDVARLSDRLRDRLDELRKGGQGQLVILGDYADIGWWNSYAKFPVRLQQKVFVAKDRGQQYVSLTTFDKNHNIFKPFARSSRVTLNTAQFNAFVEVQAKQGATVLAKFETGSPAITESSSEDRGLLVFSSTVDSRWNDLPLRPSFLPVFFEMVQYLSRYSESRGWYPLGEGIPIIGGLESVGAAIIDPKGGRRALGDLAPGSQTFFTPDMPGYYEIRVGPVTQSIAVNPPSAEGNLETMPPEDLLASVQRTQGETQQAGFFTEDEQEEYARRQMSWWYLLLFALLAGIAEIYIANRSYKTS